MLQSFRHRSWVMCRSQVRGIQSSVGRQKRHSRPGMVAEVGLRELLIDKPPDEYPSIRHKLSLINYHEDPLNPKNIGLEETSPEYQNFIGQAAHILIQESDNAELSHLPDDEAESNLDDEARNVCLSPEQYQRLRRLYPFTQHYLEASIQLGHHYAVFRDLFFQQPFRNETRRELIAAHARGQVQECRSQPCYYFSPLVNIDAEFTNNDETSEEPVVVSAYRGNLIPAEYGRQPPTVTINTSAINGQFEVAAPGSSDSLVRLVSGPKPDPCFYTLALVNLDSHFADAGVCHWMVSNIDGQHGGSTVVRYLPIYAIRGFGYHRYALLVFRHPKKVDLAGVQDFDLAKRKFNGLQLMEQNRGMTPIGLSWFQVAWSDYCKSVFHEILDMRSPTYEYVFPEQQEQFSQKQFPGRAPFNLYLDQFRHPKELAREVLLERLRSIDPMHSYDTERMYRTWEGSPPLPHIHPYPSGTPDWLKTPLSNKRAHLGRFRGLRAASATLPYNNNADLDRPKLPRISADKRPLNAPNPYPDGKRRPKPLRETLWSKPLPEHHSLRVDHPENLAPDDRERLEQAPGSSS